MSGSDSQLFQLLKTHFPTLAIRENVKFFQLTTLGAGRAGVTVCDVVDDRELAELLQFCAAHAIPVFPLGAGSNLVGCDDDFPRIFLRLRGEFTNSSFDETNGCVIAGGGVKLPELVKQCALHNLGGILPLAGIPGTIGGAIRMNAGANGCEIGTFVQRIRCFEIATGNVRNWECGELHFAYRNGVPADGWILTAAELKLPSCESAQAEAAILHELDARRCREPSGRTAGCSFRNPTSTDGAGKLIDRAGLKTWTEGALCVSEKHANYLVNASGASEQNVLAMLQTIRRTVAEKFGIFLVPEMKFINAKTLETLFQTSPAPRVAVLKGGVSSEREVSLRSGAAVAQALRNANFPVEEFDLTECAVPVAAQACDVIFPVLHGGFGEDGRLQKVMEEANLCFVGSGSVASHWVMDKLLTKEKLDELHLGTAKWFRIAKANPAIPQGLSFPCVAKVPCEGSTVGIEKLESAEAWAPAMARLFEKCDELLVEEFVSGIECTVPVVLGEALTPVEIRPPAGFYDYDAKYVYQHGHTEYFCPPERLTAADIAMVSEAAKAFAVGFGCRDIVRVDFIVDAEHRYVILEGNSLPGFTATSLVPKAAKQMGISFEQLCGSLVMQAFQRRESRSSANETH